MAYFYAIGRRKQATATVRLLSGSGKFSVIKDDQSLLPLESYFGGNNYMTENALYPLTVLGKDISSRYDVTIVFSGGGKFGQSDALKLALARACIQLNPEYRLQLKPYGLLKRDPRRKERKKPGLRGARKAPQRSKR